jgi:hypothetical protein
LSKVRIEKEEISANQGRFMYNKEQEMLRNEIINADKNLIDESNPDKNGDDVDDEWFNVRDEKKTGSDEEQEKKEETELHNALNELKNLDDGNENEEEK